MSVTPDRDLPSNVQATIEIAEERAGEAWARRLERGASYGTHPLSGLLEKDGNEHQSDVA